MLFISILILTTLTIASTAAFFSIYGLAAIFAGIFWPVVVMGASLEIGKLVAVSYIYRFWEDISFIMKSYLISAIMVLMLITSAGIFGFLSMGYQQDTLPLKQQEQQILLLIDEQSELKSFKTERLDRRKQIDTDIASLPNNFIKGRQRLLKTYKPELDQLRVDIELYTRQIKEKTREISKLKQERLVSEVHIGPIIYISKVFRTSTDDATKWLIVLIMFAFDPLAVALTIGINNALFIKGSGVLRFKDSVNEAIKTKPEVEALLEPDEPSLPISEITGTTNVSTDDLKAAIDGLKDKKLTPADIAQRGMLEEMLNRKLVTEKIRKSDLVTGKNEKSDKPS